MCPARIPFAPDREAGELALIRSIRHRSAGQTHAGLRLGIGDDGAILRFRPGEESVITTDLSIAGTHFQLDWHPPESVGHRTLSRGLSDLAAMGARPLAAFLSLGLPRDLAHRKGRRRSWSDRFLDGFLALAARFKTPLAGGDLAESPVAVADIVLIGAVPVGKALLRSGASPGDLLYVTGALGGSRAGLERLQKDLIKAARAVFSSGGKDDPLAKHLRPEPRISQGLWLQRREAATAMIDLSDGISTDLRHLCAESGVGAEIEAAALPLFPGASLEQALDGGEDYELLFAARPDVQIPRHIDGIPITRIGRVVKARPRQAPILVISQNTAHPLPRQGWEHFAGKVPRTRKARLSS